MRENVYRTWSLGWSGFQALASVQVYGRGYSWVASARRLACFMLQLLGLYGLDFENCGLKLKASALPAFTFHYVQGDIG